METRSWWWKRVVSTVMPATLALALVPTSVWGAPPEQRVYEQISPGSKNGADVIPNETRTRVAVDGDRILFSSLGGFGDVHGIGIATEYLAERDVDTGIWKTHGISAPQDATGFFGTLDALEGVYLALSSDLQQGVLSTRSPLTDAPNVASAVNLYRRDALSSPGTGTYGLLTGALVAQTPSLFGNFLKPFVAATSTDFSQVLFESRRDLTADAPPCALAETDCPPLLYKADGTTVRLVGILPESEGGGIAPGSQAGRGALNPDRNLTDGTLSQDGSRAIFTVPETTTARGGVLYLREDQGTSDVGDDTTVRINASERAVPDPAGPLPAEYWAASSDARLVFFTTREQLTDDDDNATGDVYRFDVDASPGDRLTRLSVDAEPLDGTEPGVNAVIGASSDGSYVYFTTTQDQLVLGGPTGPTGGPVGGKRIFVWHDDTVRQVAAVNDTDEVLSIAGSEAPHSKTSRLTPDGTRLIFITEGTDELLSLYGHTPYDHGNSCPSNPLGDGCNEVYVYDALANGGTGDLACASCNPTGSRPTADVFISGVAALGGSPADTSYQNHALSDDGRYVFFNTAERLQPDDHNEAIDAYEYDTTTRQLHLISGGQSNDISTFLDASPDGRDVLFTTRDRLRSTDIDQSRDLYDARIGGVPDPGVTPTVSCDGEDCRGVAAGPAVPFAPGSETSSGPDDRVDDRGPVAFFAVQRLTDQQRRRFVRRGTATITVTASQPGSLTFRLAARLHGKTRTVQVTRRALTRSASIRLRLKLSRTVRAELARRGHLRLRLTTTYSQSARPQITYISLRS